MMNRQEPRIVASVAAATLAKAPSRCRAQDQRHGRSRKRLRRRKERGRVVFGVLTYLYGEQSARKMWSEHLRSINAIPTRAS